jgi:hypothetical protein
MFSETRVGLYDVPTVANRPSGLVAKNVTKSVTYSKSEVILLIYRVPQNLFNMMFEFQTTNLCKQSTYQ